MNDDLRTTLAQTVDSRAVATRRSLTAAYVDAVRQNPDSISVVDVCRRAGVARSTFYTHFATIEDLAVSAVGDLFRDISPENVALRATHDRSRAEVTRLGLEQLLDNLWDGRDVLLFALALPGGPAIRRGIIAELAESTRPTMLVEVPDVSEAALRLATHFIAGGVLELATTWFTETELDRDTVVDQLLALLPAWMTGAEAPREP